MMGIFLKIFKTVLIALAGVFIANKFNLFSYMTFIPDDKAFDICITVYFTILELISEFLLEAVHGRRSELSVILSHVNTDVSIESNPIINFNQDDLAQMTVTVHINGMKKHFTGSKIVLSDVGFATMQASILMETTSFIWTGCLAQPKRKPSFLPRFGLFLPKLLFLML